MARDIARVTPPGGRVGVLPNTGVINDLTVRYFVLRQIYPYLPADKRMITVFKALHSAGGRETASTVATLVADGFVTLVTQDGDQGAHKELIDATVANLDRDWPHFAAKYEPVADYPLPDGGAVHLWRLHR
jgi:hypothetical protein